MATAASVLRTAPASTGCVRSRLTWRENMITIGLGLWLMIGLFVDGWAHNNLRQLETFFTPWHAVFYSGFMGNALWIGWLIARERRKGRASFAAIPQGYHLGLLGVFIFGAGGVGDMLWHVIFGIELNLEALLSPTHLMLFLGGVLIFSSPFVAAWASGDPGEDAPSFKTFLPALTSLTLMTSFAAFMNMYLWSFWSDVHIFGYGHSAIASGLQGVLITNVILLAPVLLMLRRWQLPFGAVTFLFTVNTVLIGALPFYPTVDPIVVALIAGLLADMLIRLLKPWGSRVAAFRAVAILIPIALWSLHFLVGQLRWGLAWSIELSAGITTMAALSGLGLSVLMAPPALPQHRQPFTKENETRKYGTPADLSAHAFPSAD